MGKILAFLTIAFEYLQEFYNVQKVGVHVVYQTGSYNNIDASANSPKAQEIVKIPEIIWKHNSLVPNAESGLKLFRCILHRTQVPCVDVDLQNLFSKAVNNVCLNRNDQPFIL